MFCNNCGNKIEEGNKFCNNCGTKVEISEPVVNNTNNVNKNGSGKKALLITLISILSVGVLVGIFFLVKGLFIDNGSSIEKLVRNTTWTAKDNSELIIEDGRLYWYQSPTDHTNNYYAGNYKIYRGKEAVEYITTTLSSYGVTEDELTALFNRSSQYSEEDFVVFDIDFDKFILDGKDQTIYRSKNPWYGFILKDGTYLDVANMNTGSYYGFTKK